jgi:uncharacterized protein DUF4262
MDCRGKPGNDDSFASGRGRAMSLHDKFVWPKPDHEADEIIFRNVRKHGCHIVGIGDGNPAFDFSIGLYLNYGHPELIIFGLPSENACGIINDVRDHAAAGRRFTGGDISADLLQDGYKACFQQVPYDVYRDYLGTACWFYAPSWIAFPCLQIIWSDRNGRFPGRRDACRMSGSGSRC